MRIIALCALAVACASEPAHFGSLPSRPPGAEMGAGGYAGGSVEDACDMDHWNLDAGFSDASRDGGGVRPLPVGPRGTGGAVTRDAQADVLRPAEDAGEGPPAASGGAGGAGGRAAGGAGSGGRHWTAADIPGPCTPIGQTRDCSWPGPPACYGYAKCVRGGGGPISEGVWDLGQCC